MGGHVTLTSPKGTGVWNSLCRANQVILKGCSVLSRIFSKSGLGNEVLVFLLLIISNCLRKWSHAEEHSCPWDGGHGGAQ